MRISDWSSDVCSSDLVSSGATFLNAIPAFNPPSFAVKEAYGEIDVPIFRDKPFLNELSVNGAARVADYKGSVGTVWAYNFGGIYSPIPDIKFRVNYSHSVRAPTLGDLYASPSQDFASRSEEHTSELQSLMRISYAVFCLKKK